MGEAETAIRSGITSRFVIMGFQHELCHSGPVVMFLWFGFVLVFNSVNSLLSPGSLTDKSQLTHIWYVICVIYYILTIK